jgi:hypothetical protein
MDETGQDKISNPPVEEIGDAPDMIDIDSDPIGRRSNKSSKFVKSLSLRLDQVEKKMNKLRAHMKG